VIIRSAERVYPRGRYAAPAVSDRLCRWTRWQVRDRQEDSSMLDQMRPETLGRRRRASTTEYSLLLAAIATVVALVAFAFGNYLHSTLHPACAVVGQTQAGTATCVPPAQH
jgi:hypothetical protein